jgi:hypothetical protein
MRLLILLVVLIAVAAVIQTERNHCYWGWLGSGLGVV